MINIEIRVKINSKSISELWGNFKWLNICVVRRVGAGKILEEITAPSFAAHRSNKSRRLQV